MSESSKDKLVLLSITIAVLAGVVIGAIVYYFTKELAFGLKLSYWFGLLMGVMCGGMFYIEKLRRERDNAMSTLQIALISLMLGASAAMFSFIVAEPDSKIKATLISGLGATIVLFILILKEQEGHKASRRYNERQRRRKRDEDRE